MAGKQGFASMDKNKQKEIAAQGGRSSHNGGFKDRKLASRAGKIGGKRSRRTAKV